jgi:hypothetical protein
MAEIHSPDVEDGHGRADGRQKELKEGIDRSKERNGENEGVGRGG